MFSGGIMRGGNGEASDRSGRQSLDRGRIDWQRVAFVDYVRIVTEFFWRPVIVQKAVVFPLDVVQFGVDVSGNLLVAAQFVGEEFETPAHVPIAVQRANAAVFAIDEGLPFMQEAGDIIETRADE